MRAWELRKLAKAGKPTRFMTLTIRFADGDDPDQKAQELKRAWRLLRDRIKKRFKVKTIQYLHVWERTKRGAPHLHIFLRGRYLPQKWVAEQMDDLIGSPIVDIRKIENQKKAAAYVTKYITKANAQFKACKRYVRSQAYSLEEKREKPVHHPDTEWTQSGGTPWQTLNGLLENFGGHGWNMGRYWVYVPPGCTGPPDIGIGRYQKEPVNA